jgi:hypothetical protein
VVASLEHVRSECSTGHSLDQPFVVGGIDPVTTFFCHTCRGRLGIDVDCNNPAHNHTPAPRYAVYCATCDGHISVAGSPGEHCTDGTHHHDIDLWGERDVTYWERHYARPMRADVQPPDDTPTLLWRCVMRCRIWRRRRR